MSNYRVAYVTQNPNVHNADKEGKWEIEWKHNSGVLVHTNTTKLNCQTAIPNKLVCCVEEFVRRTKMVFEQAQEIFILEHYFQMQLYASVQEVF